MIDLLKEECEIKIGLKIKTLGDCKFLSDAIFNTLNIELNYNTLRRIWGLASYVKPRLTTLDILSQFNGYNNYSHFSNTCIYRKELKNQDRIYKLIYKTDHSELLSFIKKIKKTSSDFPNIIIRLSRELIYRKDYDLLDKLFTTKELQHDSFTYTEALYIGNSIGLLIRENPFQCKKLQQNINFIRLVYLTFVDYSSISSYYGDWINLASKSPQTPDISHFCESFTQFKKFLFLKPLDAKFQDLVETKDLHPILLGRILSVRILAGNYKTLESLLTPYFNSVTERNSTQIEMSYELIISAITSRNIDLMGYLKTQINPSIQPKFHYHKNHINVYYLMCMFYYKLINNTPEKKKFSKLFNPTELQSSYEEYITLLILIFNYSETGSKNLKARYKQNYMDLAQELNYPYFLEGLLDNYFTPLS